MAEISSLQSGAIGSIVPRESVGVGPRPASNEGASFKDVLRGIDPTPSQRAPVQSDGLKFSNHAVERMRLRGLSFDPSQMQRIQTAVDRAASKGAQNTLVLSDQAALIVAVKNRMVVTVMDSAQLKENVFTNIDSTVFA